MLNYYKALVYYKWLELSELSDYYTQEEPKKIILSPDDDISLSNLNSVFLSNYNVSHASYSIILGKKANFYIGQGLLIKRNNRSALWTSCGGRLVNFFRFRTSKTRDILDSGIFYFFLVYASIFNLVKRSSFSGLGSMLPFFFFKLKGFFFYNVIGSFISGMRPLFLFFFKKNFFIFFKFYSMYNVNMLCKRKKSLKRVKQKSLSSSSRGLDLYMKSSIMS